MRTSLTIVAVVLALGSVQACSCDNGGNGEMGVADLAGDDQGVVTPDDLAGTMVIGGDGGCIASGSNCANSAECCSGVCSANNICVLGMCGGDGATCKLPTDCCKGNCTGGICSTTPCVADNAACTAGGTPCCSTQCVSGACQPLNPTCKTAGNPCPNGNGDCCSKICTSGICSPPSQISYCTQIGDICYHDNECCTAVCKGATATTAGTCATIASTNCAVDGLVCNGCTGCCSSFCAPFGTAGSKICQPASGCHVQGDLCHTSSDCCGGDPTQIGTIPGGGLVVCTADPTYPQIGVCSGPSAGNCPSGQSCGNTCIPEGDACHFKGNGGCSVNAVRNDCCACISGKDCCKLDKLGIPRCNAITTCVMAGGDCASSADCCNNVPCLPDSTGHLKCGSMACVMAGGVCTTTSDCCAGLPCLVPPGSLMGTCQNPVNPPPDLGTPPDMAGVDLAGVDLAAPPGSDLAMPPPCSLYGQSCTPAGGCCGTTNGSCLSPFPASAPCAVGEKDCTCYNPLM
jgi:hypothetical protein